MFRLSARLNVTRSSKCCLPDFRVSVARRASKDRKVSSLRKFSSAPNFELNQRQVRSYVDEGFLVLPSMLSSATVKALRQEADRLLELATGRTQHDDIFDLEWTHSASLPRVRRIKEPHKHSNSFRALLSHPGILAVCQQLLRSGDLRRGSMKLNLKSAGYGSAVQWHQDWAFYPHTNEDLLAVGVFLDEVTTENGPPLVMPKTHRGPVFDHHRDDGIFVGGLDPEETALDFSTAQALTGAAGSVSFHHCRLVHGSDVNYSSSSRRIVFLEVAAADAWPLAGVSNFESFHDFCSTRMLCGKPTLHPRMEALPVKIPLPKPQDAQFQGSIYAAQQLLEKPYFERVLSSDRRS
eukprot:TRINITY_DN79512_c0_g1_i1.p1 TRINITY_DN79512_c0_g1~~TRINITY_DN79512_c0_g1_i1.p1  ORF type:complete len:351 (-),score=53.73 TRINITY_DN79512_c0_g1_i1:48-1100(-)